jgi:hypothetical protein
LAAFFAGLGCAHYLPGLSQRTPHFAGPSEPNRKTGDEPLLATVSLPTNLDPRLRAQLELPVAQMGAGLRQASPISDYDRQQWERRGFELIEETRYLPARLPDGREVMVPITKVHVKFKGTPVS